MYIYPGLMESCPSGYMLIGRNCFRFYNIFMTQREATTKCQETGGYLASVSSQLDVSELHTVWDKLGNLHLL